MEERESRTSSRDRISNLPETIRHHILSFLTTSDAIRTRFLSSSWRYDWTSLPFLYFGAEFWKKSQYCDKFSAKKLDFHDIDVDIDTDNGGKSNVIDYADSSLKNGALGFVLFLDQIVQILKTHKRNESRNLHIYLPSDVGYASVSMDIAFTTGDELQRLSYYIQPGGDYLYRFNLPGYLMASSNSLTGLNLKGCNIFKRTQSKERMTTEFPSLRTLSIKSSCIDQQVVECLLDSCSTALEALSLSSCWGTDSKLLQVYGFPKLRALEMEVRGLESLKINAPDLHSLRLGYPSELCCVNVTSCRNLVDLRLFMCDITNDFFVDGLANFSRLESLRISSCYNLTHIKVWSNSLADLEISNCTNLTQLEIDTPNLNSFFHMMSQESNIVSLCCKTPIAPRWACLDLPGDHATDNTQWLPKFVELLANFRRCHTLHISGAAKEAMIIAQELRESSSHPLGGVQSLYVSLDIPSVLATEHHFLQYLDSLLWLSARPKNFALSIVYLKSNEDSNKGGHEYRRWRMEVELQYKEETGEVENTCGCYPCQPINCWRHSLTDFKITEQEGLGDAAILRKFFEDVLAERRKQ